MDIFFQIISRQQRARGLELHIMIRITNFWHGYLKTDVNLCLKSNKVSVRHLFFAYKLSVSPYFAASSLILKPPLPSFNVHLPPFAAKSQLCWSMLFAFVTNTQTCWRKKKRGGGPVQQVESNKNPTPLYFFFCHVLKKGRSCVNIWQSWKIALYPQPFTWLCLP